MSISNAIPNCGRRCHLQFSEAKRSCQRSGTNVSVHFPERGFLLLGHDWLIRPSW